MLQFKLILTTRATEPKVIFTDHIIYPIIEITSNIL